MLSGRFWEHVRLFRPDWQSWGTFSGGKMGMSDSDLVISGINQLIQIGK